MRKPKITFGGMRELGVRGLLVPNVNSIFGPSWRKVRTHADLRTCCDLYQRVSPSRLLSVALGTQSTSPLCSNRRALLAIRLCFWIGLRKAAGSRINRSVDIKLNWRVHWGVLGPGYRLFNDRERAPERQVQIVKVS